MTSLSPRGRDTSFDCHRASARAEPSASGAVVSEPERATNLKAPALSCSFFGVNSIKRTNASKRPFFALGDLNQEAEFADDAPLSTRRRECVDVPTWNSLKPSTGQTWSCCPPRGALSSLNYLPHQCPSHHLQFLSQHNHKLFSTAVPAVTDSFVSPSPQRASAPAFHSSGQQPYKFTVADRAERENGVLCSSLDPTNPACLSPK